MRIIRTPQFHGGLQLVQLIELEGRGVATVRWAISREARQAGARAGQLNVQIVGPEATPRMMMIWLAPPSGSAGRGCA